MSTFREDYDRERRRGGMIELDPEHQDQYLQEVAASREIAEEELAIRREEVKAKKFESILKFGGIIVGGLLTVAQIVTVGLLEKDVILQNHPMQFVDKRGGK